MRTDDDSWDITESVGVTALGIAAIRAAETQRPDALFRDPYAQRLVAAVGTEGWLRIAQGQVRADDENANRMYQSMSGFAVARTCYFDSYFADAAAEGIRQVVILAAGLDARAYRIQWPSGTVVYELDQPKVLQFKAAALADARPTVDRREVAVDLRHDWPKALRDKGFDTSAPTAWLAEGLLRYLPTEAQDRLLDDVVALSAPGSRTALNIGRGNRPDEQLRSMRAQALQQLGVRLPDGPLWYPDEGRSDPREWFAAKGWTVTEADPPSVLIDHGRDVPEQVAADMRRQILMTAIRPRGDDNR
ncbi:SAM-dependent methyltransferase [Nocardia transvalensis]|uniref:SAM-dependent methyltransferase n=1 Tax=Nocardia transvalensis TaxID=37333 RepID=UPI001895BFF1|nr:SAM-dependent methyltransferase [Nocardia transvalensis]MBF6329878.1 SAM-dependent methyltransferase [Nocardia transvalensis]